MTALHGLLAAGLLLVPCAAQATPLSRPMRTEVAPGVHVFATPPYGDVGLDGNAVAIVSDDGVLVFDSNGTPAAAAAVLAEIRALTDQPVRFLVLSHWHWDHCYGSEVYREAFPGLTVVSHAATRALMAGPAPAFNQPGLDLQLPQHIAAVEAELAQAREAGSGTDAQPAAPDVALREEHVARDRFFLAQKRAARPVLADVTFTDSLTLHLGRRVVELRHDDRAITPGDCYLWLPAERVVVTGDLLINPITFALFCYPAGWIATLRRIDALDAAILVPGHGAPLHDEELLHATLALLQRELVLAGEAHGQGLTPGSAIAAALADAAVLDLRTRITGGDPTLNDAFALYLVDWFQRRALQELDGPLDDAIPPGP